MSAARLSELEARVKELERYNEAAEGSFKTLEALTDTLAERARVAQERYTDLVARVNAHAATLADLAGKAEAASVAIKVISDTIHDQILGDSAAADMAYDAAREDRLFGRGR